MSPTTHLLASGISPWIGPHSFHCAILLIGFDSCKGIGSNLPGDVMIDNTFRIIATQSKSGSRQYIGRGGERLMDECVGDALSFCQAVRPERSKDLDDLEERNLHGR